MLALCVALATSALLGALETVSPAPEVAHAVFTSDVVDREPVDSITFVKTSQKTIFFFTDLRQLSGQTVEHRWLYRGEVMARIPFEVRGDRWRVWSKHSMRPEWTGEWTVVVLDAEGTVIAHETFQYSIGALAPERAASRLALHFDDVGETR